MDYQYEPIDLGGKACRFVRLLRGYYGPLQCELFQAWIDKPDTLLPYEALSYTWGSTARSESIQVDSSRLAVTENLHAALCHLRKGHEDRILWIDAICIHQENPHEQSHQVQQMADIYKQAEHVLIWLGIATPETNLIMNAMRYFWKESIKKPCNSWEPSDQRWSSLWSESQQKFCRDYAVFTSWLSDYMQSLLDRDWFERIWILQEVAHARAATVICGTKAVSARVFSLVSGLIGSTPSEHCQAVMDLFPGPSRRHSWWDEDRTLRTLLIKFRESRATDPRDMIFALLGLSSDAYRSEFLKADYTKSIHQVVTDTTSFLLSFHELRPAIILLHLQPGFELPLFQEVIVKPQGALFDWAIQLDSPLALKLHCVGDLTEASSKEILLLSLSSTGMTQDVVKLLIDHADIDVNAKDQSGRSPLGLAVQNGHEKTVAALLKNTNLEINAKDNEGGTPLILAARTGRSGVVKRLLDIVGTDVRSQDLSEKTALHYAVESGDKATVELLLEKFGGLENADTTSFLATASHFGHAKIVSLLLARLDEEPNVIASALSHLLRVAAMAGHTEVAEVLLKRNELDPNSRDDFTGKTPLLLAAGSGHLEIVKLLLTRHDVDPDAKDVGGRTPLWLAALSGHVAIMKLLLERPEVDPNIQVGHPGRLSLPKDHFSTNYTALSLVARSGNTAMVESFFSRPDINFKFASEAAILSAAHSGNTAIVELMLRQRDVDVNSKTNYKETPLWLAAQSGHVEIAKLLLGRTEVDVNTKDVFHNTPLIVAARSRHIAIAKLLLERTEVDVNAKNYVGETALMVAERQTHTALVELLLEHQTPT